MGNPLELLDPGIEDSYDASDVLRCIHVGLLCVQQCPEDRPSMSKVVMMLESEIKLPSPKEPRRKMTCITPPDQHKVILYHQ